MVRGRAAGHVAEVAVKHIRGKWTKPVKRLKTLPPFFHRSRTGNIIWCSLCGWGTLFERTETIEHLQAHMAQHDAAADRYARARLAECDNPR